MIRWIFFDVGNVILNDDPLLAIIYKRIHDAICETGASLRFEDLLQERESLLAETTDGDVHRTLAIRHLGLAGYRKVRGAYHRYLLAHIEQVYPLMPAIVPVLNELRKAYHLALLANQPAAVERVLRRHQVWELFDRHFISEVIQLRKPDPEFYRYAVAQVGCRPREAIMVGDRLDNDIVPARQAGMWTIWFDPPPEAKRHTPSADWERAFFASLRRANQPQGAFPGASADPAFVARGFDQIITGVKSITQQARDRDASH